jgi:hypothetical protein
MSTALGVGWLVWAGLGALLAGIALIGMRPIAPQWGWAPEAARALIITAVGLFLTDIAFVHGPAWAWWLSGFFLCAALHRWREAAAAPEALHAKPLAVSPSKSPSSKSSKA